MKIIDSMIEEVKQESANTRKALERIPEDKMDWRPDPKSMSFAQLGTHIAGNLTWVEKILDHDEFVIDPGSYKPTIDSTRDEILKRFDDAFALAIEKMQGRSDEEMMNLWTFKSGEQTIFQLPKAVALRAMIFSHAIHHRGQLTVYLRLNGIPVPAIYGPSADEK
ncbi:DinB family protein [Candidatus Sumerlaeota bacterium]|nr:DinB family protein [Candidatus Sumerlaeota bacterium]